MENNKQELCTCRATEFTTKSKCTHCGLELRKEERDILFDEFKDKIIKEIDVIEQTASDIRNLIEEQE